MGGMIDLSIMISWVPTGHPSVQKTIDSWDRKNNYCKSYDSTVYKWNISSILETEDGCIVFPLSKDCRRFNNI